MAGRFQKFAARAVPQTRATSRIQSHARFVAGGAGFDPAMGHDEGGDEKWKRQKVGVQIGVEEREERELVDRLELLRADHARGVPVVEVDGKRIRPGIEGSGEIAGEDGESPGGEPDLQVAA